MRARGGHTFVLSNLQKDLGNATNEVDAISVFDNHQVVANGDQAAAEVVAGLIADQLDRLSSERIGSQRREAIREQLLLLKSSTRDHVHTHRKRLQECAENAMKGRTIKEDEDDIIAEFFEQLYSRLWQSIACKEENEDLPSDVVAERIEEMVFYIFVHHGIS